MISYVKLKNFISFGDICFDFRKTKSQVKNFAAIYGENGSGKTNFVTSIRFLIQSMMSFYSAQILQILQEKMDAGEIEKKVFQAIKDAGLETPYQIQDFSSLMRKCRTVGCEVPTELEYGFRYNDHDGVYRIVFSDMILEESLRFWTGKQTGTMYSVVLTDKNTIQCKLSPKAFQSSRLRQDIQADAERFWGKHSILGIIINQINRQNEIYTKDNYSPYFIDVLDCFSRLNALTKDQLSAQLLISKYNNRILPNLEGGVIPQAALPLLQRSERIVNSILTQTYAEIKEVKYHIEQDKDQLRYHLEIYKMIAGEVRKIDIYDESAGTIHILEILSPLMGALAGMTVFIDEADTGIHDILFRNIIESIKDDISGQLVITTHNTTLLEKIDSQNAYIIYVDYEGNKEAVCIDEYDVQKTNNARSMYLKGVFGGIPVSEPFDDSSILSELQQAGSDVSIWSAVQSGGKANGS